jgi:hypothetical protein
MIVDAAPSAMRVPSHAVANAPRWSTAEFRDEPCPDGFTLRALVCQLEDGAWQWSVSSLDGEDRGELISSGCAKSVTAARRQAAAEIVKCLQSPIGEPQIG